MAPKRDHPNSTLLFEESSYTSVGINLLSLGGICVTFGVRVGRTDIFRVRFDSGN